MVALVKRICLLGASGSIGSQTLDILRAERSSFSLIAVSVGERIGALETIIRDFPECRFFTVKKEADYRALKAKYPQFAWFFGDEGLLSLVEESRPDMVVNALLGFAGLAPSIKTLELGIDLALANKESLVVGRELIEKALSSNRSHLYPIDSEHVAIAKCLQKAGNRPIDHLILTASGGPFRTRERASLTNVTVEEALRHPSWKMGPKITIDSATMMNKGFEVLEAAALFHAEPESIEVVIHPESHVHSAVRLKDGKILAEVNEPDMRGPISYALHEGKVSLDDVVEINDLSELPYHFEKFDPERFPLVPLAIKAYRMGGAAPAILNAADEEAVQMFLSDAISFLEIERRVSLALDTISNIINPSLPDLVSITETTKKKVRE